VPPPSSKPPAQDESSTDDSSAILGYESRFAHVETDDETHHNITWRQIGLSILTELQWMGLTLLAMPLVFVCLGFLIYLASGWYAWLTTGDPTRLNHIGLGMIAVSFLVLVISTLWGLLRRPSQPE
jgi:hypothetical protein